MLKTNSFKAVKHWLQRGAYDHAESELRALEPNVQDSAEGLHLQAFIAQKRQQWELLENLGRKLQEKDPADFGGAFCVAESFLQRGRAREAVPVIERAQTLFKNQNEFQYTLARLYASAGEAETSLKLMDDLALKVPMIKERALLDSAFESIWLRLTDSQ
jgi:predicted Zn-dependent protease